ncbi:MAG: exopolysaccharide biosynthesis protein [Syntrophobacteraceae bacterium]
MTDFAELEPVPSRIGRLCDRLADRGLAAPLFWVGILNMLPLPPGTSIISGAPALILAWQMVLRRQVVWLPKRLLDRPLTEEHIKMLRQRIVPRLICAILAVMILVRIPFGNGPPAFSITLLTLALLQRDGVLLLVGLTAAAASLTLFAAFALSAFMVADRAISGDFPGIIGRL